ncbi:MAG: hypothetical protein WCI73_14255, partial [Phycisphaerae bacterium]
MDQNAALNDQVPTSSDPTLPRRGGSGRGGWGGRWPLGLIGLGLLANAGLMLWNRLSPTFPTEISFDSQAFGQTGGGGMVPGIGGGGGAGGMGGAGAQGFYMMPARLGAGPWGLDTMIG